MAGDLATRLSAEFTGKYVDLGYASPPDALDDDLAGGLLILRPWKGLAWSHFPEDVTRFTFADCRRPHHQHADDRNHVETP